MTDKRICVIGLGHVGLTLAVTLAERGFNVTGVEKNRKVYKSIRDLVPPFFEKNLEILLRKYLGKGLQIRPELSGEKYDIYIIAVGTPYDHETKKVRLEALREAVEEVSGSFPDGALILLRSTVPVGTSRGWLLPFFRKTGRKFHFAVVPERTCEGVALEELKTLPQVIGGETHEAFEKAKALFGKITKQVIPAQSLEVAEIIKLADNCWRDTIFAFANEIALHCERLGLDASEVIHLANLGYSRNTIPQPGFVGGPCLTKDPYLLTNPASEMRLPLSLTETARLLNSRLAGRVVERFLRFLDENQKTKSNCKVFVCGLAFKGDPPTDDIRGSTTFDVIREMRLKGVSTISCHDFVVKPETVKEFDLQFASPQEGFQEADAVFIMNNHKDYLHWDLVPLLKTTRKPVFFFDAWRLFAAEKVKNVGHVVYGGIGF